MRGKDVSILTCKDGDFVSLTDMIKAKDGEFFISDWLWNNIRDANGMVYWGEKPGIPKLKERGQRIVNLALEAPRNEAGFLPLIDHLASKQRRSAVSVRRPRRSPFSTARPPVSTLSTVQPPNG